MTAEDFAHYATGAGIILGILGAAWKWFFSEWLRRSREIPSLESSPVEVSLRPLGEKVVALVEINWKNTSSFPLYANCEHAMAYVAPAADFIEEQTVDFFHIVERSTLVAPLFDNLAVFAFEPATSSRIQFVVVLDAGVSHFIAIHIPLDPKKHTIGGRELSFTRIALVGEPAGSHQPVGSDA